MTIQTESLGSGFGILYEDNSGGFLQIAISHSDYTSNHRIRVAPFATDGSGTYTAPAAGTVPNIQAEANNVITLLAALFGAEATLSVVATDQALPDFTGVQPYPFVYSGAAAGTPGGAAGTVWQRFITMALVAKGLDGSKWRLQLEGVARATFDDTQFGRFLSSALGSTPVNNLIDYLTGVSNGPVTAAKTNVRTHSGAVLTKPVFAIQSTNKRLRRHFRVA